MRWVATAAVALLIGLALAAPAFTTSHKQQASQKPSLQAQINALKKQVKILQAQMSADRASALRSAISFSLAYEACLTAVTADAFQGSNPTAFGTAPVNDYQACSAINFTRRQNQATTSGFQGLLDNFK